MWTNRTSSIYVKPFMTMCHQPIRDQHAVTTKINSLGAHISRFGLLGKFNQFGDCLLELRAEHMIRIVPETGIAQRHIWRIFKSLLAAAAQFFHPDVADSIFRQSHFERLAIEMRKPARHRDRADIY